MHHIHKVHQLFLYDRMVYAAKVAGISAIVDNQVPRGNLIGCICIVIISLQRAKEKSFLNTIYLFKFAIGFDEFFSLYRRALQYDRHTCRRTFRSYRQQARFLKIP